MAQAGRGAAEAADAKASAATLRTQVAAAEADAAALRTQVADEERGRALALRAFAALGAQAEPEA